MLQKNKSKRIALAKYGLSAPLFVLMLILSSATVNNSKALKNITTKAGDVLLVPASSTIGMLTEDEEIEVISPVMLADTIKYTQQPSFPGGGAALDSYMRKNVVYPATDRENNIQGKVNLQFNVETDGSVTDIVATAGPSQTLKDAAIAAMKNSPKWIPGYKDGKLVKMPHSYEVNFTLGDNAGNDQVYSVLQTQPKFPGGTQSFLQYLAANIRYPADDRKNNLQGRVVTQFVVERDGSLTNIKVIRSPSAAMGDEAVRVLSNSPKWEPGKQNGSAVRAQFTVPVNFILGDNAGNDQVYSVLETQPKFPGGTQSFLQYLAANIRYPKVDRDNNVQGRVVAQFVVEKDGSLSDIKAIRSPSAAMGEEAVRVLSNSPKWEAGKQNGSPVRAQYTVPVNFTLGEGSNSSNASDVVVNSLTTVRGALSDPNKKPLIIVDGVEASDVNQLDQNNIESMTVLRGATATSIYGEKAKNGAIIVTTKNGKSPKQEAPAPPVKKQ